MTEQEKEDLLKEAKRRYPVGTKFKCLHGCNGGPVETYELDFAPTYTCVRVNSNKSIGCIYDSTDSQKWATIIPMPKQPYFIIY